MSCKPRDGFLLVTLGWLVLSAAAAVPLLLVLPALGFTGAFFEAMSGLTTTGSTVLSGLDTLPPSLNFWRASLHWFGGLGIIVMALAVLPLLGVGGMQLYKGQAPGPVKEERLAPRITETAESLWLVYALITAAGIVALKDLRHVLVRRDLPRLLGGRSRRLLHPRPQHRLVRLPGDRADADRAHADRLAELRAPLHRAAKVERSTPTGPIPSASAIFAILSVSVVGIAALLAWHGVYPEFMTALRHSAFNVVSQATTSGLTSQDYQQLAGVRALLDAVPVVHRVQHRLDRRRHQDVPHAAARRDRRGGS